MDTVQRTRNIDLAVDGKRLLCGSIREAGYLAPITVFHGFSTISTSGGDVMTNPVNTGSFLLGSLSFTRDLALYVHQK